MRQLTIDEIKERTRYVERLDPILHEEDLKDCIGPEFQSVFILAKTEKRFYVLLEYDENIKEYKKDIERLAVLTAEQLENGEAYYISEILDEDVVVYDIMDDGRIETCQGFTIEIFEE